MKKKKFKFCRIIICLRNPLRSSYFSFFQRKHRTVFLFLPQFFNIKLYDQNQIKKKKNLTNSSCFTLIKSGLKFSTKEMADCICVKLYPACENILFEWQNNLIKL